MVESFSRVIGLGYYDGPTSGVAECGTGVVYRFEMLDERPDPEDGDDLRVFSLAELPAGSLERLARACPGGDQGRWPIWVPIWTFASTASQEAAEREVQAILDLSGAPRLVIVADPSFRTIVASHRVTDEDLATVRDWFAFLGLGGAASTDRI